MEHKLVFHHAQRCSGAIWEWDDSYFPNSKIHGAIMGPIWGRQEPGGPHVGPMNFAIWVIQGQTIVSIPYRLHSEEVG